MKKNILLIVIIWSLLISVSLVWNIIDVLDHNKDMAVKEARALFNKDKAFRLWGAMHGGVYVPITEKTPPNPFLSHIKERDINTTSGKQLTLMNPAYMVRQMMQVYEEVYGVKGHITSDVHFRSETAPDEWEKIALERFKKGEKEVVEISKIDDKEHLRLMQPLFANKDCLKCHGFQGYKEGELRGGVSLSLPLEPYSKSSQDSIYALATTHIAIWLIGLAAIFIFSKRLSVEMHSRQETLNQLIESERYLRAIMNAQPNIVIVNNGQRFTDVNMAFFEFFSQFKTLEEFQKEHNCICEFFEEYGRDGYLLEHVDGKWWLDIIKENPKKLYKVLMKKDGKPHYFAIKVEFLRLGDENKNIATFTDITTLEESHVMLEQRVEDELRKRELQEAKMLNQARLAQMGEMLTMISHHWRQPLSVIGLTVQNLLDAYKYGELTVESMERESEKITRVLEELSHTLTTLSSLSVKQKDLKLFDVSDTTKKLCELSKTEMNVFFINFIYEIEPDVNIVGIPAFYTQIFMHLLKNAQEAVSQKDVSNRAIKVTLSAKNDKALLVVQDSGSGIKEEHFARLFDPFFTTKEIATKTGLGLYIVKMIVEQQFHGSVEAQNHGDGAKFTVTFPNLTDNMEANEHA